jgi:hypothetical protein
MAYMLIQQKNTDTDNQYILYQYGNDIKEKTKIIKKDSNIRKNLITFSIPGSNTIYECSINTFIQIKNIKDKNHCIQFFTYIKCSKKFDKDNLYDYIKNNNVIFNIKYRLLFRNNYIYDEFEEHYDVKSSIIDKINIKYEKNGKEHYSKLNIFIQNNDDYSEIFFNIV